MSDETITQLVLAETASGAPSSRSITLTGTLVAALSRPCVYKAFTKNREVLYVGVSAYGIGRFLSSAHHRFEALTGADHVDVEFYETPEDALVREYQAIASLRPIHNRRHKERGEAELREAFKRAKSGNHKVVDLLGVGAKASTPLRTVTVEARSVAIIREKTSAEPPIRDRGTAEQGRDVKSQAARKHQQDRGKWKKDRADRGLLQHGRNWYVRYKDALGKMRVESVGPRKSFARKVLERRRVEQYEAKFFRQATSESEKKAVRR
jgi:hypothetical protein